MRRHIGLVVAGGRRAVGNEDLTENFCTNNENVDQLEKLNQAEKEK